MEQKIGVLKKQKNYDGIIAIAGAMKPEECNSAEVAHAIGKAYEKKEAYSQSIPWYRRSYELNPTDEALGMIIGVCLAVGKYELANEILDKAAEQGEGYYYCAGRCEVAARTNAGADREIETIEMFLDVQEEESYMLRLAMLYLQAGRDKEAGRLCKKMRRLFVNGAAVDYADKLLEAIKDGKGLEYVNNHPWNSNMVFKHISFDVNEPLKNDVHIDAASVTAERVNNNESQPAKEDASKTETLEKTSEEKMNAFANTIAKLNAEKSEEKQKEAKPEKKEKGDKVAQIVEKCLEDVVGMQELKISMNNIYNLLQVSKKKNGAAKIMKDNLRILGPDGCGKTTAAFGAAKVLAQLSIVTEKEPVVTDYYNLIGADSEETHNNIHELFVSAQGSCILIDNIHEFDDAGAYSLGLEAIDQLVKAYYVAEEQIPFIITGSEKETEALLRKKKKFAELFNLPPVILGKYSVEELVQIAYKIAEDKSLILDDDVHDLLYSRLEHLSEQSDFRYSADLEDLINRAYIKQSARLAKMRRISEKDAYLIKADDFGEAEPTETVEELLEQLNSMIGLAEVKAQVNKIVNQVKVHKMREDMNLGGSQKHGSLHLVFLGNAGTGKTTVAKIVGKIYKRLGVLPSGHFVECTRRDLVSSYVGATAQKVADKIKEAMGGILFIDEAYALCKDDNDTFGKEAIDALLVDIENHRDSIMVILAGYSNDMNKFMDQNQGLRSRIPTDILFEDYSTEEMVQIFKNNAKKENFFLEPGIDDDLYNLIETKKTKKDFGNARGVRNLYEAVKLNQDNRLGEMDPNLLSKNDFVILKKEDLNIKEEDIKKGKTVEEYLEELNSLTGLASVKEKVNNIISSVRVNLKMQEMGVEGQGFGTLHMVFKGNAGTGKTTVARIIAGIYRELGILSNGQMVESDRSSLVAGFSGQTAGKVKDKVKEAMGGILFIDEAYALCKDENDSFGQEAVDTLVADIENYRNDLMVIIAGYSDDMDKFLQKNQGLKSRFPTEIIFEDYSVDEMLLIFKGMIKKENLIISEEFDDKIKQLLEAKSKVADFGNARGVRNVLDKVRENQKVRIAGMMSSGVELTKEDLQTILEEDLGLDNIEVGEKKKSADELLQELNSLTGLASVKERISRLVDTMRVNKAMEESGLKTKGLGTLHMVFKGNAGTGKTTVARMLGAIYRELGILSSGHVVECDRSNLVADHVGGTAKATKAVIQKAQGGILFIDEAYMLAKGGANDFGKEAIDTLVADVENLRGNFMVVIAGYSDDMDVFLEKNQGLKSRFPHEIIFEDYSPEEMLDIFKNSLKREELVLPEKLEEIAVQLIAAKSQGKDFGNARGVRNLVDAVVEQKNVRMADMIRNGLQPTEEDFRTITKEDLEYFL